MFIQKAIDKEKACHRGGKIFRGGFEHKMMAEFLLQGEAEINMTVFSLSQSQSEEPGIPFVIPERWRRHSSSYSPYLYPPIIKYKCTHTHKARRKNPQGFQSSKRKIDCPATHSQF